MSYGNYDRCLCSHPYPEHSMFDTCHGCADCPDDDGVDVDDDHPYQQCECRQFRLDEARGEDRIA